MKEILIIKRGIYMKMKIIIIFVILIFSSCMTNSDYAKKWINNPPYNFNGEQLFYIVVEKASQEKYLEFLSDKSFTEVDKDVYKKMSGKTSSKKYIIALRALYTNLGGEYYVIQSNTEIWVDYCVLGSGSSVYKSVLLVEVDQLPSIVYVSYTMAK